MVHPTTLFIGLVFLNPSILLAESWIAAEVPTKPPITSIAFSPDGKQVIATSQLGLHVLTWPELKTIRTVKLSQPNLHAAKFSESGLFLAVGGGSPALEGVVTLFSWPDMQTKRELKGHTDTVQAIEWIDDSRLVSASIDRSLNVWNLNLHTASVDDGVRLHGGSPISLSGHSRRIEALCLLPDGKTLISTGADQSLRVWDLSTQQLTLSLNQHTGNVLTLALRPDVGGLPMVASGAEDRTIRFWQPSIGRMVRYIRLDSVPMSLAWLPNSALIAAACRDGKVRIIDVNRLTVTQEKAAISGWAYAIAAHPDDGSVAVGGSDGQLLRFPAEQLAQTGAKF